MSLQTSAGLLPLHPLHALAPRYHGQQGQRDVSSKDLSHLPHAVTICFPRIPSSFQAWGGKGGALYVNKAFVSLDNISIRNNTAKGAGGAIYALETRPSLQGPLLVKSCTFTNNTSLVGGGQGAWEPQQQAAERLMGRGQAGQGRRMGQAGASWPST
jgi:predicted outer membrane repeat protein